MANLVRRAMRLPLSGKIGLALVLFWIVVAVIGPWIAPYPPGSFVNEEVFAGSSSAYWLGSDFLGRDVLSRLLSGARFTVGLSAIAVAIAAGIGTGLALTAAVGPRWLDELLSRSMDTLISIPSKIFALVLVAAFGSSLVLLTMIIAITYVPGNFRIARSLAVGLAKLDYVEVARARGEGRLHLALVEVLPNMIKPLFADIACASCSSCCCCLASASLASGCSRPMPIWDRWCARIPPGLLKARWQSSPRLLRLPA